MEIGDYLPDVIECVFDVVLGVLNLVDERLCLRDKSVILFDLVFNLFMEFVALLPCIRRLLLELFEYRTGLPGMPPDMLADFLLGMLLDMLEAFLEMLADFLEEAAELSVFVIDVVSSVRVLRGRGDVQLCLLLVVILLVDDELVHTMYEARAPEG